VTGSTDNHSIAPPTHRLVGAVVFLQLVGSFAYPIAKFGLDIIEPFTFAFYRFLLSSLVLLLLVKLRKKRPPVERRDYGRIVLLGIMIIPLNQTLFLLGQSLTGAGHGAFLFATTPVWIFVLALIHLKETFRARRAVGIAVALAGVLLIMFSGEIEVRREYLVGDLIIVASVVAWAYYTVLGKPMVQKYGALRTTAYALASGSAIYFPFGLYHALQYDYSQATLAAWGSIAYMAIALSFVVYVLWYYVLTFWEASRMAVYHNVQPVIASFVAWIWLGEALTTAFLLGGAIVIIGVVITETRARSRVA
jgi:drug/metabolite transporter (DMT)-like permease